MDVDVTRSDAELVSDRLLELGAVSVSLAGRAGDEVLEPDPGSQPLWQAPRLSALLPLDANLAAIRTELLHAGARVGAVVDFVGDREWHDAWRQHAVQRCFGERLWVIPRDGDCPTGIALRLDPGLAFGTGAHPTTALCLDWLAAQNLQGRRVLDFGCGSGILALAASLLGASHVVAVDHDPQALRAVRDNAAHNGVAATRLTVRHGSKFVARSCFDVVVANILAQPLIDVAPSLTAALVEDGTLVLSGLLADQAEQVARAYSEVSFAPPHRDGDWVRLVGVRNTAHG